ncbi:MAG: ribosome maturation factor RimM [Candidatus Margulisiibacteriota bacterium]|mgnify:CR=1 FL=1
MTLKSNLFPLGKLIKPHGLRGDITLFLDRSWFTGLLSQYPQVIINDTSYTLISIRRQARFYVVRFSSVDQASGAEDLRNHTLYCPLSHLKAYAKEHQIYLSNLWIGFSIKDKEGRDCGTVEAVIPTGSNDVLELKLGDKELLVPVTAEYILSIDEKNKQLIIKYPEMV